MIPYRLGQDFAEFERLADRQETPRDVLNYRLRSRMNMAAIRQPITMANVVNICFVERRREALKARLLRVPPAVNKPRDSDRSEKGPATHKQWSPDPSLKLLSGDQLTENNPILFVVLRCFYRAEVNLISFLTLEFMEIL
jgi:hypothetical protein